MTVRVKFKKTGPIRYIGHLDFMRFFQKAIRRSGIKAAFTKGFSPHMILSFGAPLGVGDECLGDYFDVELAYRDPYPLEKNELIRLEAFGLVNDELPPVPPSEELVEMLNKEMPEGVEIISMCRVVEKKGDKVMAMVRAADYMLGFSEGFLENEDLPAAFASLLAEPSIMYHKVTKKTESDVDIRPLIYDWKVLSASELDEALSGCHAGLYLRVSAGSVNNLKPEALVEVLCERLGLPFDEYAVRILRLECYAENLVPLSRTGQSF